MQRLSVNLREPGLENLDRQTIIAVTLIILFALSLVAGIVVALILAAIKRARLAAEVEATLTVSRNVYIHAQHVVGQQPDSRCRTLCTSPVAMNAVLVMENMARQ
jgi:hypothetical protein